MANKDNLMPIEEVNSNRTREQHSEDSRKAGIASGEARRRKRDLKRAFEELLEGEHDITVNKKTGEKRKMVGSDAIALAMFQRALQGNSRAFEMVRDTAGQKPVEKIMVSEVDQDIIDEVERMVLGDD